ncbi:hypothetical protein [Streptomyces sp. NRRL B-24484]|uniref:hypothetical protein n=1 Tax=Streptomyces sp. NRRL B-24484 TaxID=1463833 RepID=UPI0004BF2178|nr:hypothetical protein [Streptomyces sp. NRRL B-24484]
MHASRATARQYRSHSRPTGRPVRARLLAAPLLALTLAGTAACSGSGGDPHAASAPAPAASSGSPTAPAPVPTSEDLRSALLTTEDLGPAFAETLPADGTEDRGTTGCPLLSAILNGQGEPRPGAVREQTEFTTAESSPYLGESLLSEEQGALADDHAKVAQALRTCEALTFTGDSAAVTFTLTPIRFGGLATTAVRMDGVLDGVLLNGYLAVEQIGPAVLTFWYFQSDGASAQLADEVYRAAAAKVLQVLVEGDVAGGPAGAAGV